MATLTELIARATVARSLGGDAGDPLSETDADRVAALGAAGLAIAIGADRERAPIAAASTLLSGRPAQLSDALAAEIGPLLWRVRYAGAHALIPRLAELISQWIATLRSFRDISSAQHSELRLRVARRLIDEDLRGRCRRCEGSGKLERARDGKWIKPRGAWQRNATFRLCPACSGSGKLPPRHAERCALLGISRADYERGGWARRFNLLRHLLDTAACARLARACAVQLERPRNR